MRHALSIILAASLLSLIATHRVECQRPQGTIAYVREGKEIRLIAPDGTNDRRLWAHPRPDFAANQGISTLAWRPGGAELAFSSGHEAVYSLFQADLYAIRPDGSGLRKLTNPPTRDTFVGLAKGTVRVTVHNDRRNVLTEQATGLFIIYVAGAPEPQSATVPPGRSQTLTFTGVADLGNNVTQTVVAMNGPFRWFNPGVDVRAGAVAQAPTLEILGGGVRDLAASIPMWRYDGTQVGYAMGCAGVWVLPSDLPPGGGIGLQLPATKAGACGWGWGPTQRLADQIILAGAIGDNSLYITRMSSTDREKLLEYDGTLFELRWHPSGSSLFFVKGEGSSGSSLNRYDFASKKTAVVKTFSDKTVRGLSISPDGEWVVVEFGKTLEESVLSLVVAQTTIPELWVMRLDGTGLRLLVKNGQAPSWGV
ncbi:MAG TPA: hypothetical protein VJM50_06550 [Pyrinomonadaceae bacterium]|nr:hypothetical protein [Pyrinomonadaceae bacterium]